MIETDRVGTGAGVASQYVWGLDYVNDLVEYYSNASSGSLGATGSGLGQRVYAMTDANFDIIAAADTGGTVLEAFDYDPYRTRTATYNSAELSWSVTDTLGMAVGSQGGIADAVTGLVHFNALDGNMLDDNTLNGRWQTLDLTGADYPDGANLYQFVQSSPADYSDPAGLSGSGTDGDGYDVVPVPPIPAAQEQATAASSAGWRRRSWPPGIRSFA